MRSAEKFTIDDGVGVPRAQQKKKTKTKQKTVAT